MSVYRAVLGVTVLLGISLAIAVLLLRDTDAVSLLSVVVIAEALSDIVATVYIATLVIRDRRQPRSWLLLMLLTSNVIITASYLAIGYIVARRFLGLPPLEGGMGLMVTGMALVLMGVVPVMKAVLFAIVRHRSAGVELPR